MVELGSHAATERVAMVTLRLTCVARPDSIPTSARYVPWEPEVGDPSGHPGPRGSNPLRRPDHESA
jgi:hypothetical protein